jgi:hypothetical protein
LDFVPLVIVKAIGTERHSMVETEVHKLALVSLAHVSITLSEVLSAHAHVRQALIHVHLILAAIACEEALSDSAE